MGMVGRPSMWRHPWWLDGTAAAARVLVAAAHGGLGGALRSSRMLEARFVGDASVPHRTSQEQQQHGGHATLADMC